MTVSVRQELKLTRKVENFRDSELVAGLILARLITFLDVPYSSIQQCRLNSVIEAILTVKKIVIETLWSELET